MQILEGLCKLITSTVHGIVLLINSLTNYIMCHVYDQQTSSLLLASIGSLSWLDGSDVSYSNWLREPEIGEACGYILKESGFQWASTKNCSQEFHFICEFG